MEDRVMTAEEKALEREAFRDRVLKFLADTLDEAHKLGDPQGVVFGDKVQIKPMPKDYHVGGAIHGLPNSVFVGAERLVTYGRYSRRSTETDQIEVRLSDGGYGRGHTAHLFKKGLTSKEVAVRLVQMLKAGAERMVRYRQYEVERVAREKAEAAYWDETVQILNEHNVPVPERAGVVQLTGFGEGGYDARLGSDQHGLSLELKHLSAEQAAELVTFIHQKFSKPFRGGDSKC